MLKGRLLWIVIFVSSLLPAVFILNDLINEQLGANPIQTLHFRTGDWALRFLLITLALTPMRVWLNLYWQQAFRRMMGLFSFFYASLHTAVYFVLDQSLSWNMIQEDVPQRPYVLVGLAAFILLIPLAITSAKNIRRRMLRYWKPLHRSIYVIAILSVVHYYWLVKADLTEPTLYASILFVFFLARLVKPGRGRVLSSE